MTPMTTPTRPLSGRRAGALATALCISGALLLSGCSKSPAQIEKKDYGLGEHYLSEGKVNEAIIEFQNVLKVNPKSVKGRLGLADAYMKKGWTTQAVLEYREVAKEDPLSLPAHLAMARYGVNSGQWTAVEPEIAAILKIDPNNVEGLTFEGERQLALGHQKEAEDNFRKALALSPGSVPALVGMGDLFRKENLADKASSFYQQALAKDPSNGRALTGLGYLAQTQGKTEEAKENFQKAMEADKGDLRSRIIYTNFLAGQGKVQEAIDLLKAVPKKAADLRIPVKIAEYEVLLGQNAKAIALMRPLELQKIAFPDIYLVLAKAYQNSGQIQKALDEATKLSVMEGLSPIMKIVISRVELAGRNPGKAKTILDSLQGVQNLPASYWATLALTNLADRRPDKAVQTANAGLALYPYDLQILSVKSDALLQQKKFKEALATVDMLLTKDPQNSDFLSRKGILLERMQGASAGISFYKKVARKYPNNPSIEVLYVLSLSTSKHLPQAISESVRYLSVHPDNNSLALLLSDFYLQSGEKDKALSIYKKVIANDPKNIQALSSYGLMELQRGHKEKAESLYRQALRANPDNSNLESGLGEALLAEGQIEAAENAFKKSLENNPKQVLPLLELGRLEVLSGDAHGAITHLAPLVKVPFSSERKAQVQWLWGLANQGVGKANVALEAFQKAVHLAPKNVRYRESLADYWASRSLWDKAVPEFEKIKSMDPKNPLIPLEIDWGKVKIAKGAPDPHLLKAVVREAKEIGKSHPGDLSSGLIEARAYVLLKKNDQALSVYEALLSAHPDNFSAMLGKANVLFSQNHLKKSGKIAKKLIASHPDDIRIHLLMASIDQKENNVRGMVDHLEKVHQLAPSWASPALSLAAADLSLKRYEEAKSIAFSVHEAHPDLTSSFFIQASSEMGLGEYRAAEHDFVSLARQSKKPGSLYNEASVAAAKAGDQEDALKYLNLAYKNDPENPGILNNMAYSLAWRNTDLPRALAYSEKALKKDPQPYVQDTVGYVLFRLGHYDQAESHFAEAYKANFRDPEFLFHMGLNEWKLGKKDKAEGLLRKAVTSGKLTPDEQREAHRVLQKIS